MFHQSYQQLSFQQQIIALNQTYPCPRCNSGMLELFGYTETFKCNDCQRSYVPLCGARMLHPALRLGSKIAPTFWWDGLRWHWAGTTATSKQILAIVALSVVPIILINLALTMNFWKDRPEWCSPILLSIVVGLMTLQMIYLICWDFETLSRGKSRH
jgi:hypothetical protein